MIDLKHLKKTQRIHTDDKRNFKLGLRADRNEKVVDWPPNIFKKIFTKIKPHEFTAYYNTTEIKKIKKQVARYFSLKEENFIINHGGDGVIKEFLLVNYHKGLRVLLNGINYEMYKVYFDALKIKYFEAPYKYDLDKKNIFDLDKNFFQNYIKKSDIIFFTNPNQISNQDLSFIDIKNFCKKYPKKLFFIDESYYDFGHYSFIKLTKSHKNIFVMRSITKTFGLASARIGFLIAHKDTIKSFKAMETPYPISLFSGKCLKFFLENKKLIKDYNKQVKIGREYLCKELEKRNYKIHNSKGLSAFIYFKTQNDLQKKHKLLLKKFIYTKKIKIKSLYFLRITCGPKKQMMRILKNFKFN